MWYFGNRFVLVQYLFKTIICSSVKMKKSHNIPVTNNVQNFTEETKLQIAHLISVYIIITWLCFCFLFFSSSFVKKSDWLLNLCFLIIKLYSVQYNKNISYHTKSCFHYLAKLRCWMCCNPDVAQKLQKYTLRHIFLQLFKLLAYTLFTIYFKRSTVQWPMFNITVWLET